MKVVGILGTSGMAREVGDIAWALGIEPVYVAQNAEDFVHWSFSGEVILEADMHRHSGMEFVIGVGDGSTRERIANRFRGVVRFTNLIHPSATFGRNQRKVVESSCGVVVCAGVRLTSNIHIGEFAILNQNSSVAHDVIVEEFVHIAPGACVSGNVHLEKRSWIGAGAVINQGTDAKKLRIGADTVIGSGAVVTEDCMARAVYVGIPAKRIK